MYASQLYGTQPQIPSAGIGAVTEPMGISAGNNGWANLIDPHNGIFWFGVFLLATVGAAGVSGSARLGPARGSVSLGDD